MKRVDADATVAVEAFALALMSSFGQLTIILDHMHRFRAGGGSAPDAPPPPFVLHDLLRSVLQPLAEQHGIDDVATATQMLESATRTIGDELFMVDASKLGDVE